uniref:NB-ARC domain-containing protein n=1 Tax=Oryza brachyantha TaxID=4533 RepID=J3KZT5_ORYBR
MVNRQVSNYLLQQYQDLDGMEEQLTILERKLPAILDVIIDAEEQGAHCPGLYRPQMPFSKQWRQTDSIIIDSQNIVSREEEKQHVVNKLLANRNLMVLPIIGMGGLGKTTFAQIIYNDPETQKYFQLRKWVCVLDDFDVTSIANKISMSTEKECENALEKLQLEVHGKRCLLILDDVWNCDAGKWPKLKFCLQQYGGVGSAILVTARDQWVAQLMGTTKAHQLVKMEKEDLLSIFESRAFRFNERKPDELVQIGREIMGRCHGSPLVAKALGSMLSTRKGVEEWRAILTRSSICDDEMQFYLY